MSGRTETLAKIGLFQSLDAKAIGQLDAQCSWRRATAGQWLIDYQDASNDVFFVVSGSVRVMIQSAGREVLLRQINAGEFFGELAAIDGQPRSSGIVAMTDVMIARMPASVFRAVVHAHSAVCDRLLGILAGQIRSLANRVNEFSTLDVRYRIYAELLRLSRPEPGHHLPLPTSNRERVALMQPSVLSMVCSGVTCNLPESPTSSARASTHALYWRIHRR